MSRRAFALAVAVALHVGFAWVLFAPKPIAPLERRGAASDAPREAAPRTAPRRDARATRPRAMPPARYEAGEAASRFETEAERRGYERGVAYELARREALQRYYARTFGDEIADLMRRPLGEAWRALEARALAGDDAAAHALTMFPSCEAQPEEQHARYRRLRESAVEGLAPADRAFVHGALDTELLDLESHVLSCRAEGLGDERLAALAERRFAALGRPEPPPAGDDRHAWRAYFDRAFGAFEGPDARIPVAPDAQPWLDRLERSLTRDEWAELARRTPDDPTLATRIAYCAMARCPELPPEAWHEAEPFIQRAAEYGFAQAISGVAERESGAGSLAQAHAWAEFGMWVIEAGCFPIAQSLEYAQLARQRAAIAARLAPAQHSDARRRFAALIQQHGNAALAAQGCTP